MSTEKELEDLAKEELLRDVKRAAIRADQIGAHGWADSRKLEPNKRFLRAMLLGITNEKADLRADARQRRKTEHFSRERVPKTRPLKQTELSSSRYKHSHPKEIKKTYRESRSKKDFNHRSKRRERSRSPVKKRKRPA